ncbi:MAG: M48 family metalloprotease [Fischerella sp.]|jgi:Zn-dependent protease with chaperone function|uniref:zinc metalloprotease HtpX n=1 Tax=Fischerella sp. TaxID=1191 RepID=UPI0017BCCCAD|nr:zinc metalloprotease HtpX [Fischerella sp.]NWF60681.1 M48 family metalloprotease [Fischerella sp.]
MPSHPEPSLKAGLTALKQGNYQTAKTILEAVTATTSDRTATLQAEIGLVVAYARSGEVPKAIALCETLTQSDNPQVKEWAERSLQKLTKRYKNHTPLKTESKTDVTGFVPFENSSPTPSTVTSESEFQESENREGKEDTGDELITSQRVSAPNSTLRVATTRGGPHAWLPSAYSMPRVSVPTTPSLSLSASSISPTVTPSDSSATVNRDRTKPLTIYWRQAGRARVWQPLPKRGLKLLRLLQLGTFVALFWVIRALLMLTMRFINDILVKLPFLEPIQLLYTNPTIFLLISLFLLFCLSPWLLDRLLAEFYGQQPLAKDLLNRSSKEAVRVLQRYCQQRGWQTPKLFIIPLAAPVAFTYGNLPRTARIVVSRGLLEQLADDEIATIYASQLGHIAHRDYGVMSLVLLVTIPVYQLYRQFAEWGDRSLPSIWHHVLGVLASLIYCVWCLLVGTALWLSQLRLYYSDRVGAEVTGNPNGLTRALLKIAIGIAGDVQKQEHTSWQLESLNIVMPVGYEQSLCLGSIASHTTFESFLMWDNLNPYRWWFVINNTHPLIGDRLQRLCQIARNWHVVPELYLESQRPLRVKRQSFLLQIAPFLGIILGIVFGGLIWLIWQIIFAFKILNLTWIYDDWNFLKGSILIGFSIGILLRINSFFPNIKPTNVQTDDRLPNLLTNPAALPIDSTGVRLVGKLLGRQGTSNYLGQDLILQSSTGLVKLHHVPWLRQGINLQELIGRQIVVTGWLRRGATPWIDIQSLQTQGGRTLNSPHPILSIVLAVAAEVWGAYILLRG